MRKTLRALSLGLSLLYACHAYGQSPASQPPPATPQPRVVRMTVSPVAAPCPALKYLLMPDLDERTPGNAAGILDRVATVAANIPRFEELPLWRVAPGGDLLDQPVDSLRTSEIRKAFEEFQDTFRALRTGCFRDYCHWDIPYREEGTGTLLPNLRFFRLIAKALALQTRIEIADGQFDKAFADLRLGYIFAQYVGNEGTFIHTMVGAANLNLFLREAEGWIGRPDAPNLYYALACLPRPFFRLSGPFGFERGVFIFDVPAIRELDRRVFTQAELDSIRQRIVEVAMGSKDERLGELSKEIPAAIKRGSAAAKAYVKREHPLAPVASMLEDQISLLYAFDRFQVLRDDVFRWFAFPYAQGSQQLKEVYKQFDPLPRTVDQGYPFTIYLSSLSRAYYRLTRTERDLAALQLIESLRLHAAAHKAFPASLAEIELPVPTNPLTGEPFQYEASGNRAVLTASAPGESPADQTRYELELRQ